MWNDIDTPIAVKAGASILAIAVLVWMAFWVGGSVMSSGEVHEARNHPAEARSVIPSP